MSPSKASWIDRITVVVAGGLLVYVLTAPPIIMAIARQRGGTLMGMSAIYRPVFDLIESDFGGPLLWYFNDVWDFGITLLGNESGPLLPVILAYAVAGAVVLGALALPFLRRKRRQVS